MNRFITQLYFSSLLLLASSTYAETLTSSITEGTIGLGIEHSHSNNIRKSNVDQKSGYEQRADIVLGYKNQTASNNSSINYGLYYSHYSESDIENESDISGSLTVNQQLFSKNLQLDLSHFRHSYLLQQTVVDLPGNSGDRDVFTVSPLWRLPYSNRAGFDTRYTFTAVRLSDDEQQDTNRNALSIAWYHALNSTTTYQLNTQYSEIDFITDELTYKQVNIDMSLTGRLNNGSYLARAGYNQLTALERHEKGGIFQVTYNYHIQRSTLSISAQRELTDSSLGLGEDKPDNGDIVVDGTKLIWIDRVSLDHTFFAVNNRLTNINSIHYQYETAVATRESEARAGISTEINWKHNQQLSTGFKAQYRQMEIEKGINKKEWLTSLSSSYHFYPKLVFALTAQYEKQKRNELLSGYDEARLSANIRFSY